MSALKTPLPQRRPTYRFALTPLADAMFQLLVFFMATTSITPYSLITLRSSAEAVPEAAELPGAGIDESAAPQATPPPPPSDVTLWTLGDGRVTVGDQVFESDQLADLADAVSALQDPGPVVLLVTAGARMQDVAAAMEALRSADVANVQITTGGA